MDHLVDVGHGDGKTDQHVAAVARLPEFEAGAADDHLFAEFEEDLQQGSEAHLLGAAPVEGQHVHAERALQRGEAVELVQHHVAGGLALQLDNHPHAFAVALVPEVGDALDTLFAHQLGDPLDQARLVHLVGNGRDDDGFPVLADLLH